MTRIERNSLKMNPEDFTLSDTITIEAYNDLRRSVEFIEIRENRAKTALDNALYKVIAYDGDRPVGMTRVVGDGGYVYFICDVIVRPEYQSHGLGRRLIEIPSRGWSPRSSRGRP